MATTPTEDFQKVERVREKLYMQPHLFYCSKKINIYSHQFLHAPSTFWKSSVQGIAEYLHGEYAQPYPFQLNYKNHITSFNRHVNKYIYIVLHQVQFLIESSSSDILYIALTMTISTMHMTCGQRHWWFLPNEATSLCFDHYPQLSKLLLQLLDQLQDQWRGSITKDASHQERVINRKREYLTCRNTRGSNMTSTWLKRVYNDA